MSTVGTDWYVLCQLVNIVLTLTNHGKSYGGSLALRCFKANAGVLRRYLQRYLSYADLGSRAALDDTLAHVFSESGYRATWDRLLPADKAVLRALAQEMNDRLGLSDRRNGNL